MRFGIFIGLILLFVAAVGWGAWKTQHAGQTMDSSSKEHAMSPSDS